MTDIIRRQEKAKKKKWNIISHSTDALKYYLIEPDERTHSLTPTCHCIIHQYELASFWQNGVNMGVIRWLTTTALLIETKELPERYLSGQQWHNWSPENISANLSLLKVSNATSLVRSEIFTAVTMDNAIFWDVMKCVSRRNRRFGGTQHLNHQGDKNRGARDVSSN
jgi:hypothetical protein